MAVSPIFLSPLRDPVRCDNRRFTTQGHYQNLAIILFHKTAIFDHRIVLTMLLCHNQ
jgi:hypothetical protein